MARWAAIPDLHIYHYAPYEPAALKRLMGRYATREEEIDRMLRAELFVDLYASCATRCARASRAIRSRSWSRSTASTARRPLADANIALANLQADLNSDDIPSITEETKATVLGYNKDDCRSTVACATGWKSCAQSLSQAARMCRGPQPGDGAPNEKITDWLLKIIALIEQLTADVPADPEERNEEQQARWLLANMLDWHRREDKAVWWEYFGLPICRPKTFSMSAQGSRAYLCRRRRWHGEGADPSLQFPPQETELRGGEDLRNLGGDKLGKVEAISFEERTVDIKKRQDSAGFTRRRSSRTRMSDAQVIAEALVRIGEHVAEHGLHGDGPYQAARDLLLRRARASAASRCATTAKRRSQAALRLCGHLAGGMLPIQGPPGAGKTFTGAQMICELVRQGKTVGITANSHKVIRNLIDETIKAADEQGIDLQCCHKADEVEDRRSTG